MRGASLRITDSVLELETDTPVMGIQCSIIGLGAKGISFVADTVLKNFSVGVYAQNDTTFNMVFYTLSGPPLSAGRYRLGMLSGLTQQSRLRNIILSDENGTLIPTGIGAQLHCKQVPNLELVLYPNPCTSILTFHSRWRSATRFTITVSDLLGATIFSCDATVTAPGVYIDTWNCTDFSGQPVPSGIYMCTISDPSKIIRRSMFTLRR